MLIGFVKGTVEELWSQSFIFLVAHSRLQAHSHSNTDRTKEKKDATMEGSSATTAQPTMDATTPGIDVSTPNTISPAVLNDAVSENVKNIKRKVISVSKLMEIFKNKESGAYFLQPWKETFKAIIDMNISMIQAGNLYMFIHFYDVD